MATNKGAFKKGNKAYERTPHPRPVNNPALPEVATKQELMIHITRRIRNGTFKGQVLLQACKLLHDMQDQGSLKVGWQSCAPTVFQDQAPSIATTVQADTQEATGDGWQ